MTNLKYVRHVRCVPGLAVILVLALGFYQRLRVGRAVGSTSGFSSQGYNQELQHAGTMRTDASQSQVI